MEIIQDPESKDYWNEPLIFFEEQIDKGVYQSLQLDVEDIGSLKLIKRKSRKKSYKDDDKKVLLKYEYRYDSAQFKRYNWLQKASKTDQPRLGPVVKICGQFNEWQEEEMEMVPLDDVLCYRYQALVPSGQLYNFHILINN